MINNNGLTNNNVDIGQCLCTINVSTFDDGLQFTHTIFTANSIRVVCYSVAEEIIVGEGRVGQKHLLDLTFWSVCFALYRDYRTVIRFGNNSLSISASLSCFEISHTLYLAIALESFEFVLRFV
ncbi:hypothetical protein CEXT_538971 [Caerostris extrusa]|uniref:Uncharacterized protein n=1 Tax=Caerostris extrusa TaxID=172846 RepID=A0AAV4WAS4_CAEEX|nr:hypothetical protein CEXT_538971 [Caerostris extrusa]